MNGSKAQTHLLQSCFEAWCTGRPTLPKEAEGQRCGRILHPNRHKRLTLTLFQGSPACLCCGCSGCAYAYTSLYAKTVYLQLFSALLHQIVFANFSQFCGNRRSPSVGPGVFPRSVSRRLSHSFLCCQPKWNVMSCQENCEAISELSGVRSVTFGVEGSWCLPGALGPNWDLSAKPGELPRLLSFSFTHSLSLPLLSLALPLSLFPHAVPLYLVSLF